MTAEMQAYLDHTARPPECPFSRCPMPRYRSGVLAVLFLPAILLAAPPDAPAPVPVKPAEVEPDLPDGTDAARKAMAGFRLPTGMKVELFAAEPKLASPVAIALDEKGRVFVAEEYRFNRGAPRRTAPVSSSSTTTCRSKTARRPAGDVQEVAPQVRRRHGLVHQARRPGPAARRHQRARPGRQVAPCSPAGSTARSTASPPGCWPGTATSTSPASRTSGSCKDTKGDRQGRRAEGAAHRVRRERRVPRPRPARPDLRPGRQALLQRRRPRLQRHDARKGRTLSGPRTGAVFRCDPDGANLEVVHPRPAEPAGTRVRPVRQPVRRRQQLRQGGPRPARLRRRGRGRRLEHGRTRRSPAVHGRPVVRREDVAPAARRAAGVDRAAGRARSAPARAGSCSPAGRACPTATRTRS